MSNSPEIKKYLKELLIRGASQADAARLAEVSLGYVSQLMSEEEFRKDVELQRGLKLAERASREVRAAGIYDKYLDLEDELLTGLKKQIGLMKVHEKVRLLQAVSAKKAPEIPRHGGEEKGSAPLVNITLQQLPNQRFVMNAQSEIVSLGSTDFVPMSGIALKELAREVEKERLPRSVEEINRLFELEAPALSL